MAWIKVTRDLSKQEQLTSTYSTKDGSVTRRAIYTYIAEADGKTTEDVSTVDGASDGTNTIPTAGSLVELADGLAYTVTQTIPKRVGPTLFENQVTMEFDYTPTQSTDKWNVSVTFSGVDYSQDAYQDKDGKAVVNSATQPFDPTLKHTYNDEKISISYNTTLEQSESFTSIRGKVNSSAVTLTLPGISRSFGTRCLRCDDAEQSDSTPLNDSTPTFKVTINLTSRADSFVDNVIDQGYYYLDDSTNELVQIKDKYGDILSAPALLDGTGYPLDPGSDPVFLTFKIEDEADFTTAFEGLGS